MHYFVAVPYGACENAFQCIKAGELWFTWEAFAPCHIMISSVGKREQAAANESLQFCSLVG